MRGALTFAAAVGIGAAALQTRRRAREAERRLPPVGRFLEIDGLRIHYVDRRPSSTQGAPVVFLHGTGSLIEEMELSGAVAATARTNRVLVFDRPGYGYSDRPRTRLWTPRAQADLLHRALGALGVDRAVIVGHSWGTLVALALALDHPTAVGGLILIGGYYYPTVRLDTLPFALTALPLVGDVYRYTVEPRLGRALAEPLIAKIFAPLPVPARFISEYPLSLALRPSQLRATDEDAAMMVPAAAMLARRYREVHHPTLILAGTGDRMVDPKQALRLHRELPQSALRLYPGIGHMLHHAMPESVAAAATTLSGARAETPTSWRAPREWYSEYRPDGDGTVAADTLIDGAMADSFPASDPPAYMAGLQIGRPPH